MGSITRRKPGAKNKQIKKANLKVKRYNRDVDQVVMEDMLPENAVKLQNQELDETLPGLGQHYCLHCTRYFLTDLVMAEHFRTKEHKKRMRVLKEIPYSHEEADRAAGLQPATDAFKTDLIYKGKGTMEAYKEEIQKRTIEKMQK